MASNPEIRRYVYEHLVNLNRVLHKMKRFGGTFSGKKLIALASEIEIVGFRRIHGNHHPSESVDPGFWNRNGAVEETPSKRRRVLLWTTNHQTQSSSPSTRRFEPSDSPSLKSTPTENDESLDTDPSC
ncbi:hypothetical protein BDY24DRAFT_396249 [Mrakia frigida]|uniref:uncharacterized protein n=1 Tax=Mrakia frigida TaxID=29902 RepID=UPI003FCBF72D